MIPGLEKVNSVIRDEVNDAMFLRQPARPGSGEEVLQRFGLPDSREGFTEDCFDEIEEPQSHLSIISDPELEILPKPRMEDRKAFRHRISAFTAVHPHGLSKLA